MKRAPQIELEADFHPHYEDLYEELFPVAKIAEETWLVLRQSEALGGERKNYYLMLWHEEV